LQLWKGKRGEDLLAQTTKMKNNERRGGERKGYPRKPLKKNKKEVGIKKNKDPSGGLKIPIGQVG